MKPFALESPALRLDLPVPGDAERMLEYCQDPLFERFMVTPWPYRREHATGFLGAHVPDGWASDREYTWALREAAGAPLMGVLAVRRDDDPGSANLGYWIGAQHRGHGHMTEAVRLVVDWALGPGELRTLAWECFVGNVASAIVARRNGFRFTGTGPARITARDGGHPPAWHAERTAFPGPAEAPLPWPI